MLRKVLSKSCTLNKTLRIWLNSWRRPKLRSWPRKTNWSSKFKSRTNTLSSCRGNWQTYRVRSKRKTMSTERTSWRSKSWDGSCLKGCWSQSMRSIDNSFSCLHRSPRLRLTRCHQDCRKKSNSNRLKQYPSRQAKGSQLQSNPRSEMISTHRQSDLSRIRRLRNKKRLAP